jgi:glycosyltransferase involved in cell wall biosynthesis
VIVVAFGTYNSDHAANALLLDDLRRAGAEVRTCHAPLWQETRDKHRTYFAPRSLGRLAVRYLRAIAELVARFPSAARGAELIATGFNGQLDVLLARLLARGRRILFAPLVTITETLVDDRGDYRPGSLAARLFAWIDRRSFAAADVVLVDTRAHRDYVVRRLGVRPDRLVVHYLGAEAIFAPAEVRMEVRAPVAAASTSSGRPRLRVLAYSSYLPLHGTLVIARAAGLLRSDEGIEIELIGNGPERAACDALVGSLSHVAVVEWIPYAELPARIAAADVVLGIFGTSEKARIVVPNKVYQAAQVGRAIVTADSPAIREVLVPEESVLAIDPRPEPLAAALRRLQAEPELVRRLAEGARRAIERVASPAVRARRVASAAGIAPAPSSGCDPGAVAEPAVTIPG